MLLKKNKGITLVALVITIVILLILAGISISALTNTGIFQKAKDAKSASENAEKEQNKILDEYETALDQYNENTLVYKINNGTVKIGDYVSYTPDEASTDEILDELGKYSGATENKSSTLLQETLNWRVLDVKDGHVRLISAEPTKSTIALRGFNGYNNAVKLLDDTCDVLYNKSVLVSKVQNLKIEDIQDKMKIDYTKIDNNYGKKYEILNKNYPSILLKEKEQEKLGESYSDSNMKLSCSEQKDFIKQDGKMTMDLLIKYTCWGKAVFKSEFKDGMYYDLFINKDQKYMEYAISSRCISVNDDGASFDIRNIDTGYVGALRSVLFRW